MRKGSRNEGKIPKPEMITECVEKTKRGAIGEYRCYCGKVFNALNNNVKRGNTFTCGCLQNKTVKAVMTKHDGCGTRIYSIWTGMMRRCYEPKFINYKFYGGRGITVCDEWHDFATFRNDTKNGYADNLTLDRIDNNIGYWKSNVRWIEQKEQKRNMRSNRLYEYNGETKCIAEWAEKLNINESFLRARLNRGMSVEDAILIPNRYAKHKASR